MIILTCKEDEGMVTKSGQCPVCQSKLQVSRLTCPNCMSEYPINETLSPYDCLSKCQLDFLATFLKCRGNLKSVGEAVNLSYPAVKRRLDQLLTALGYAEEPENDVGEVDMSNWGSVDYKSINASAIIKRKLYEHNGAVTIPLLNGERCRINATNDGAGFTSNRLDNNGLKFEFRVFDIIVDLLLSSEGGRAKKGNGRGKADKVGYGKCTPDTVVGTIAINYFGKEYGKSTFDPVFVLAAILDWADIARNCWSYMELTTTYRELVRRNNNV